MGPKKATKKAERLDLDGIGGFPEREDYERRAFAAWFRSGGTAQPSKNGSTVEAHDDKHYVVLRNGQGVLAVYRIRNDGMLKGLKRWPKDIE